MTRKSYTIGQVGKRYGLSRSALLYYDSIGLLRPSGRSVSNYRRYSEADCRRLDQINLYRSMGVPLKDIARILASRRSSRSETILKKRLADLDTEIARLRGQQRVIVALLKNGSLHKESTMLNKDQWVQLLRNTGMSDDDMHRWHREFEKMDPASHDEFLRMLGVGADEVARIREWSKKEG